MRKLTDDELLRLELCTNKITYRIQNQTDFISLTSVESKPNFFTRVSMLNRICVYYWHIVYKKGSNLYYTGTYFEMLHSINYNCTIHLVIP